jgi:hypothetical protein
MDNMHLIKIAIIIVAAISGTIYFYNNNSNGVVGIKKDGLLCLYVGIILIFTDILIIFFSPGLSALPDYLYLDIGIANTGFGGKFIFIGYAFIGSAILLFILSLFKGLHNNETFK